MISYTRGESVDQEHADDLHSWQFSNGVLRARVLFKAGVVFLQMEHRQCEGRVKAGRPLFSVFSLPNVNLNCKGCWRLSSSSASASCVPLRLSQWDEVSVLDDKGKLIRTFEVCNVNQNQRQQDNWLATPFLYRLSAPRVFVTLRFSVRDCASLRSPSPTCRETLTLYYKQADSQRELERTWVAEVRVAHVCQRSASAALVCLSDGHSLLRKKRQKQPRK